MYGRVNIVGYTALIHTFHHASYSCLTHIIVIHYFTLENDRSSGIMNNLFSFEFISTL